MANYNFDEIVSREGTNSIKWDAREHIFGNKNVLPLWVADMDFRTPPFIVDAIKKRAEHEIYGYTFKNDSYYNAIIGWMKRRHNWEIKKGWISFSPGVVAGITYAIESFSKPGEGVVVQPPVYFPFFDSVKGTDRKMIENPLKLKNGRYYFDLKDLEKKVDSNTKILLLCNPQNPGGMVWSKNELTELAQFCLENKILILSDEIHSDLAFSGFKHTPVASLSEEIADNTVTCMAPSKTFNIAGLASSILIIPDKRKWLSYERTTGVGHLGMGNIFGSVAMEAAYTFGDEWVDEMVQYLEKNYRFLENFFKKELPEVRVMKPEGTYLVWIDFRNYGMKDKELSAFLAQEANVGLNNGAKFGSGGDGWMRINIGCPQSILQEGLERIKNAFKNL
ncbi:MAG: PatB family C-S lyase [Prolixibacteraceae bacterium]|nr:PatB family C-S lyase [Prolixibacteraceae bacterium]MBN2773688.1 PatB family C-S lyase [Prolixibacteraceae bacterium]